MTPQSPPNPPTPTNPAGGTEGRNTGTASNGAKPKEAYSFEALPGGVVRLTMNTRLMHLDEARPLCGDIEDASGGNAVSLVVDVGRVGLATPAAAYHGFRTLRHIRVASIALVHASPAMRRMATLMLRAARFPRFGFFDDEEAAVAWIQQAPDSQPQGEPRASPRVAPTPSGRRRAAAIATTVTAAALAGGRAAIRRRRRRKRRDRAWRRGPLSRSP